MAALERIDLSVLHHGSDRQLARLGAQVRAACEDLGFFSVVGHGLSPELLGSTFEAIERFFALSHEEKQAVRFGTGIDNRGYDGLAQQQLDQSVPPDWNEAYVVAAELSQHHPLVQRGTPMHGPNVWPRSHRWWRTSVERFYHAAREVSPRLLRVIGLSLDLPADYFEQFMTEPVATLRMLHYPAAAPGAPVGQLGAGAHTDWGAVSFVAQRGEPGLQVQLRDGSWFDVDADPAALVVNLGDMMQRWTNDRYRSTVHRVLSPQHSSRYSMAFFMDLDFGATVACLPTCHDAQHPRRYRPITAGEHLMGKYRAAMARAEAPDPPSF